MRTFLAFAILLAGCTTTTEEMQNKTPEMRLTSARAPDEIEQCVSLKLSSLGKASTISGKGQRIIDIGGAGSSAMTVTITDGSPNLIEARWSVPIMNRKWKDKIRSCI